MKFLYYKYGDDNMIKFHDLHHSNYPFQYLMHKLFISSTNFPNNVEYDAFTNRKNCNIKNAYIFHKKLTWVTFAMFLVENSRTLTENIKFLVLVILFSLVVSSKTCFFSVKLHFPDHFTFLPAWNQKKLTGQK